MFLRPLLLILVAGVTVRTAPANPPIDKLRDRAQAYYVGWQKKDVDLVWNFLSSRVRHHDGSEAFKEDLRMFFKGTTLVNFYIKKIDAEPDHKDVAFVTAALEVEIESERGRQRFSRTERSRWVFDTDGQWYVEDHSKVVARCFKCPRQTLRKPSSKSARFNTGRIESLDDRDSATVLALDLVEKLFIHCRVDVTGAPEIGSFK
jgi:hypothetical protein